jgi:hypothetical protein
MTHNEVSKASDGALYDVLSVSVTKLCVPPKTYVAPNVDHGTTYTWN